MIGYVCSCSELVNWVYWQISYEPGVLFPRGKSWEFHRKVWYPDGATEAQMLVLLTNRKECLFFVPIDALYEETRLRFLADGSAVRETKKNLGLADKPHQLILLTSERHEERILKAITVRRIHGELLVLKGDRIEFALGGFSNPRLEFRLSQLQFDPDLIPGYLTDCLPAGGDHISRAVFYQQLFHRLDRHWIKGDGVVRLNQLIQETVPLWKQYRKADQQEIRRRIGNDLATVFRKFYGGDVVIEVYQKKPQSNPETVIRLPSIPADRKTLSAWSRKQRQALDYLRNHLDPILETPLLESEFQ
jgi:hypothetical protein